jgi:hypothetical protein
MLFEELEAEIAITLRSLRVNYKKVTLSEASVQFVNEEFGVILSVIRRMDYGFVAKEVMDTFPGYRYVYISTQDSLIEKRDEIVWAFMEGGYMRHIRQNYNRQFTNLMASGFSNKIIRERLRRWSDKPMYRFFVENDEQAKNLPVSMILSEDPGYFDYMPKEY